jgi:RNA polymerase sigma-70 factor (ECF subfamily)
VVAHLPNETELVAQAKDGNAEAFTTLLRQYDRYVFRVAFHITGNREDAEDVMQEAFYKAFSHLGQFQGNSLFYTWLVRIAVNEGLMKIRRREAEKEVSLDEPMDLGDDTWMPREIEDWNDNPEQRYAKTELENIVSDAVQKLPRAYRTVYLLRDVEGLSTEEAADLLQLSIPSVKSRVRRARLMMREQLNAYFRKE